MELTLVLRGFMNWKCTTFPQATYWSYEGGPNGDYIQTVEDYGMKFSRMNPYHRFDFGINFHKQKKI